MNEPAKAQKAQRNDEIYQMVLNANGERVRGLWTRFGVYYARLDANNGRQYRYRLEHADTVPQAVLAKQALKLKQRAGRLLPPRVMEEKEEGIKEGAKEGTIEGAAEVTPKDRSLWAVIQKYQKDRDTVEKGSSGITR